MTAPLDEKQPERDPAPSRATGHDSAPRESAPNEPGPAVPGQRVEVRRRLLALRRW